MQLRLGTARLHQLDAPSHQVDVTGSRLSADKPIDFSEFA